jgi:SpoVK/Ycf46/Vps4 family AAA+-type ATPase
MLPRLADLWRAQKIMYFVATNHIEYFDRAVTRSQRFDAILYIGPPSFKTKQDELIRLLSQDYKLTAQFDPSLTREKIEASLPQAEITAIEKADEKQKQDWQKGQTLPERFALSKFALLRWDELAELASEIAPNLGSTSVITSEILEEALKHIKDSKSRALGEYYRFVSDTKYERYDMSKTAAWRVEVDESLLKTSLPAPIAERGKHHIITAPVGTKPRIDIPGVKAELLPDAKVLLRKASSSSC